MEQHDLLSNDLTINSASQAYLTTAAKWGKFLAIIGFIFCGFIVLGGIFAQAFLSSSGASLYTNEFTRYIAIFYVILALILFFPCLYLFKFSNKTLEAIRSSSQESLDNGFMNLKSMFKFYGIFTIVMLCFYALAFLFGIGASMLQ